MSLVERMRESATYLRGSWKSTHCATADLLNEAACELERLGANTTTDSAAIRADIISELNSWDRRFGSAEDVADSILEIVGSK